MMALMSMWFPTLCHPIPKVVAISCSPLLQADVPTFYWVASPVGVLYFPRGGGSIIFGGAMHSPCGGCGVGVLNLLVDLNQFDHRPWS